MPKSSLRLELCDCSRFNILKRIGTLAKGLLLIMYLNI